MHRRRSRRVALILGWLLVVAVFQPAAATQYSPPWADIFGFNYSNLDTRGAAGRIKPYFSSAGYSAFNNTNVSAPTAMASAYAQSDAIWVAFGHSSFNGGGALFCEGVTSNGVCNPNANGPNQSWLFANESVVSRDYVTPQPPTVDRTSAESIAIKSLSADSTWNVKSSELRVVFDDAGAQGIAWLIDLNDGVSQVFMVQVDAVTGQARILAQG